MLANLQSVMRKKRIISALFAFMAVFLFFGTVNAQDQVNGDKKAELERQIQKLEEEAGELDQHLKTVEGEKRTLANEVEYSNSEIKRRELEIKRFNLAISKADLEILNKGKTVEVLTKRIESNRKALASSVLFLYTQSQENFLTMLLRYRTLSAFFSSFTNVEKIQFNLKTALADFREERSILETEKEELQDFQKEQQGLRALQEVERRAIAQKKKEKDELLRLTKGKEALFQQLLKSKKRDITTIRTQLFYLEKTGITAEDAIRFADLAAKRAGIRTAFLLALLEVETGRQFEEGIVSVGTNVGTGNWRDDLYLCYQRLARYYGSNKYNIRAEREKDAFFSIMDKLGLDPEKMPVSKEPPYVGCGGAMGPAQFIPSTWLLYEKKVAKLTGHNPPNPWNVEDAFTASAIFLSESGADLQTPAGELAAAKTYISGSPSCSRAICRSYANRILSLAKDIDRIL